MVPFALPSGCRLASLVVYIRFDHSKMSKSLKLHIPHWIAGDHGNLEDDAFVISPCFFFPEGEQMYTFTAMGPECTSPHDRISNYCIYPLNGRKKMDMG